MSHLLKGDARGRLGARGAPRSADARSICGRRAGRPRSATAAASAAAAGAHAPAAAAPAPAPAAAAATPDERGSQRLATTPSNAHNTTTRPTVPGSAAAPPARPSATRHQSPAPRRGRRPPQVHHPPSRAAQGGIRRVSPPPGRTTCAAWGRLGEGMRECVREGGLGRHCRAGGVRAKRVLPARGSAQTAEAAIRGRGGAGRRRSPMTKSSRPRTPRWPARARTARRCC